MHNSSIKLNEEHYIGGTWLMVLTSWVVEAQQSLSLIATCAAIVLSCMGIANYIMKWRKRKY
jgi:hypothetical protein